MAMADQYVDCSDPLSDPANYGHGHAVAQDLIPLGVGRGFAAQLNQGVIIGEPLESFALSWCQSADDVFVDLPIEYYNARPRVGRGPGVAAGQCGHDRRWLSAAATPDAGLERKRTTLPNAFFSGSGRIRPCFAACWRMLLQA